MTIESSNRGQNTGNPEMGYTKLSDREILVVQAKVNGISDKEIKTNLEISPSTYYSFTRNIRNKAMDMFDLLKVPNLDTAFLLWRAHGVKYKYIKVPEETVAKSPR